MHSPQAGAIFIEQFVDSALGNSAYLVGSHDTHTAMLIDPLRDVDRYRAAAERLSARITHVLDTHLHNDFISGARELAAQVGARIGASAAAGVGFEHLPLAEGDALPLGSAEVRVLATPGHTPEHIAFLLADAAAGAGTPRALFSGGALIVGGAARTDLLGHDACMPLTRQLYHTLHHKLLALPDSVAVYPTHGAGSFCAAPASSRRTTTIGDERRTNPLAQAGDENDFVARALTGLPSYPVYYKEIRPINQRGPRVLGGLPDLAPLSAEAVHGHLERGTLALDVRPRQAFAEAHIPGAYGIELDTPLVTWAGWLIPYNSPLILIAADAHDRETAVRHLMRIGYDQLLGYLEGGLEAWGRAGLRTESVSLVSPAELHELRQAGEAPAVLDVRQASEWQAGHIPGAIHLEAGRLPREALPFARDQPVVVYCAAGSRSMAAVSVLRRRGFTHVAQVDSGLDGWAARGYEVIANE